MLEELVERNQMVLGATTSHNVVQDADLVLRRLIVPFDASNDFHGVVFTELFNAMLRELPRHDGLAEESAAECAIAKVSDDAVLVAEHLINMKIEMAGIRLVA